MKSERSNMTLDFMCILYFIVILADGDVAGDKTEHRLLNRQREDHSFSLGNILASRRGAENGHRRKGYDFEQERNVEENEVKALILKKNESERIDERKLGRMESPRMDGWLRAMVVTQYLCTFGYLPKRLAGNTVALAAKRRAYKEFQRNYNLPETGICDTPTKQKMSMPRCGHPDTIRMGMKHRTKRYILSDAKWSYTSLTYGFDNSGEDLPLNNTKSIIGRALKYWADESLLEITEVDSEADILISFLRGAHNRSINDSNFDGPGKILAHAFNPEDGDVHFDADENWSENSPLGVNLLQVATHELGHSLGLNHSNVAEAVMAALYAGYVKDFQLHPDDKAAIQDLYGTPDGVERVVTTYGVRSTPGIDPSSTWPPMITGEIGTDLIIGLAVGGVVFLLIVIGLSVFCYHYMSDSSKHPRVFSSPFNAMELSLA